MPDRDLFGCSVSRCESTVKGLFQKTPKCALLQYVRSVTVNLCKPFVTTLSPAFGQFEQRQFFGISPVNSASYWLNIVLSPNISPILSRASSLPSESSNRRSQLTSRINRPSN